MRIVRLAMLLIAAVVLNTACEKTADSPGKGDTAVPYGGAGANGSIGSTPGYLNAAGADKNPNAGATAAAAADTTVKRAASVPAVGAPAVAKP